MRPALTLMPLLLGTPLMAGCLARTAVDIVTLPVKAGSKAVDLATTSQSEADEKRGRALRKQEERLGKLARQRDDAAEDCRDGSARACDRQRELEAALAAERDAPLP